MLSYGLHFGLLCAFGMHVGRGSCMRGGRVRASLTLGLRAWSPAQEHPCLRLTHLSTSLALVIVSERLSLEIYAFG